MAKLPQQLDLIQMQNKWAAAIDPVLTNPIVNGIFLKNINLIIGDNVINHKLGRNLQGFQVVDMINGYAQLYRKTSPFPALTMILNSSATTTVSLYVF